MFRRRFWPMSQHQPLQDRTVRGEGQQPGGEWDKEWREKPYVNAGVAALAVDTLLMVTGSSFGVPESQWAIVTWSNHLCHMAEIQLLKSIKQKTSESKALTARGEEVPWGVTGNTSDCSGVCINFLHHFVWRVKIKKKTRNTNFHQGWRSRRWDPHKPRRPWEGWGGRRCCWSGKLVAFLSRKSSPPPLVNKD